MELFWAVLRIAALSYAGLLVLVYLTQGRMLYYPELPERALKATPAEIGLAFEPLSLTTEDGERLAAWFLPSPQEPAPTLLFFHGNAGNMGHRLDSLQIFHQLGLAVLIFDYRGYGESTGSPDEPGTYRDGEAAWRYLTETRGIPPEQIILFGRSLGGAVAAELAGRHNPAALILESTFTSVPEFGAELYPFLPVRWLSRYRYDTRAKLPQLNLPLLIVHSRDDEIIAYHHAEALYAAASEPKRLLTIHGDHNGGFLLSGHEYRAGLAAFLAQLKHVQP